MLDMPIESEWIFSDSPLLDPDYPAGHISFRFWNGADPVHGRVWVAPGADRKGCVIMSPQTWGGDCFESIIPPLLRAGINVLSYIPRGMWDRTQPAYTMYDTVDDLHALIEYVQSEDYEPVVTGPYPRNFRERFDHQKIALFGFDGGGSLVSLSAVAESSTVHNAIAVAVSNAEVQMVPDNFRFIREVYDTVGTPTFADAMIEMITSGKVDRVSAIKNAGRLASKNLLLIGASQDTDNPLDSCHRPVAKALRDAGARNLTDVVLEADHWFMNKRNTVAKLVVDWLRREAAF